MKDEVTQAEFDKVLASLEGFKATGDYHVGRACGLVGAVVACAQRTMIEGPKPSTIIGGVVGAIVGYRAGKISDTISNISSSHSPICDIGSMAAGYGVTLGVSKLASSFDDIIVTSMFGEEETVTE